MDLESEKTHIQYKTEVDVKLPRLKSLRAKLVLLALLGFVPTVAGLFIYVLPLFENYYMTEKQSEVRIAVDLVIGALNNLTAEVTAGKISEQDAKDQGREIIRQLKYNKTDYMFAYTYEGVVAAHGLKREMEGTSRADSTDAHGKLYVRDFIKIAKGPGEGFVDYYMEKEKGGEPLPKISYVKVFPQWGWLIGTGIYVDGVKAVMNEMRLKVSMGLGAVALVSLLLALLFAENLTRRLTKISSGLQSETQDLAEVAQKLAKASESLSAAAAQQSASLQETSASVEQTTVMIVKNANSAKESQEFTNLSSEHANRGKKIVEEMSVAINTIAESTTSIATEIRESNIEISKIIDVINEISEKTKVINDIVFQTKLLSFNASVEAARAGDHGKGFAVVAEEIGKLARMSGSSAHEISELLENSIQKVKKTVELSKQKTETLVQQSQGKVEIGLEKASRCSTVLDEIVSSIGQVSGRATEIAEATAEQSKGVSEISLAISQLDTVSQSNQSSSQDASDTAARLNEQIINLNEMAETLSETIGNGNVGEHKQAS